MFPRGKVNKVKRASGFFQSSTGRVLRLKLGDRGFIGREKVETLSLDSSLKQWL